MSSLKLFFLKLSEGHVVEPLIDIDVGWPIFKYKCQSRQTIISIQSD